MRLSVSTRQILAVTLLNLPISLALLGSANLETKLLDIETFAKSGEHCKADVLQNKILQPRWGIPISLQPELRALALFHILTTSNKTVEKIVSPLVKKVLGSGGAERIKKMVKGDLPLAFANEDQFNQFKEEFNDLLNANMLSGYWGIDGTSTTFFSLNPRKNEFFNYFINCPDAFQETLVSYFDRTIHPLSQEKMGEISTAESIALASDIDIHIKSEALNKRILNSGARVVQYWFSNRDTAKEIIGLQTFRQRWQKILKREIGVVALLDATTENGYLDKNYVYKIKAGKKEYPSNVDRKPSPQRKALAAKPLDDFHIEIKPHQPLSEDDVSEVLKEAWVPKKKPNIIFILADTFRGDLFNPTITPFLSELSANAVKPETTIAGATATHHSLYSMFYGRSSFEREHMINEQEWKLGAPPLMLLKNMGYRLHTFAYPAYLFCSGKEDVDFSSTPYSRTETAHNELLFGADRMNTMTTCARYMPKGYWGKSAGLRDLSTISSFIEFVKNQPEEEREGGNFYFVYLYSTHFPYGVARGTKDLAFPSSQSDSTLWDLQNKPSESMNLENNRNLVINSYQNAARSIDYLVKQIHNELEPKHQMFSNSIVVFASDHGEQLYNKTHKNKVGHGGYPLKEQIEVPLFISFPGQHFSKKKYNYNLASNLDIFPTIFDYLKPTNSKNQELPVAKMFQGHSLFKKHKNCALTVRPNRELNTYLGSLFDGKKKLIFSIASDTKKENPSYFDASSIRVVKGDSTETYLGVYDENDELDETIKTPAQIVDAFSDCLHLISQ